MPFPKDQSSRPASTKLTTSSLGAYPGRLDELGHPPVKGLLLFRRSAATERHLHQHRVLVRDAEVARGEHELAGRMGGHHLEAVIGRDGDGLHQGAVDGVGNTRPHFGTAQGGQVNSLEGHTGRANRAGAFVQKEKKPRRTHPQSLDQPSYAAERHNFKAALFEAAPFAGLKLVFCPGSGDGQPTDAFFLKSSN